MASGPPTGARLGTALADLSARARVRAKEVTLPLEQAMRERFNHAFMERLERDLADINGPAFTEAFSAEPPPDHLAGTLGQLDRPQHFGAVILLAGAAIGIVLDVGRAVVAGYAQRVNRWAMQHEGNVPMSPEALAVAVLKGAAGIDWAADEAGGSGMQRGTWEVLLHATGDPPGPEALMAALRRGIIDEGRFAEGIRQGRVRDDWTATLEQMRYGPPGAGLAVTAAVQSHLEPDQARALIAEDGIDPKWFDVMYETAGRPPGVVELGQLVNRGELTEDEWAQAIRESDIKNKYIPALQRLRFHIPPMRTVVSMVRRGVITEQVGVQWLTELGYVGDKATAMIAEATATKAAAGKELTVAQIIAAYEDGLLDRPTAQARIVAVNHPDADAGLLLDLADDRRTRAFTSGAVNRVRTLYVGYRIDHPQASGFLDQLGVRADQRDHWLTLWQLERDANQRDLTPAQIGALWARSMFTDTEALTRLVQLGYTEADAGLLLELQHPKPKGGRTPGGP